MSKATVKTLMKAKEAYYNGKPIMTDADFDALEDDLRKVDPSNDYFKVVGAMTNSKTKVKHAIPMLSAGKGKTPDDVADWAKKMGVEKEYLLAQPKIDGLSGNCVYENGKLVQVATRGDGEVGQDITHVAQYIDIPKTITMRGRVEVRGEFYLPKNNTFISEKLRNNAVGLINRKDRGLSDLKHVKFVAYQVFGSAITSENEKMGWLKTNKFNTVWSILVTLGDVPKTNKAYLNKWREEWEYETDGLIFVVDDNQMWDDIDSKREVGHHHHYMIALKPPSEGKETILENIEWRVSRHGNLIPVALVQPVVLGGATVKRCTLNNYENVETLKLHKGDKVVIEMANDVIPFFKENLTDHKIFSPSICPRVCPSCGGKVKIEGIHLVCHNADCEEQTILKVIHWVKTCNMEFFSESGVRTLFAAKKITNARDLYDLKASDLKNIEGFGSSRSANALAQIANTKEMTIEQFLDRLGIELVGEKACKKMGITNAKELLAFNDPSSAVGRSFIEFMKNEKEFVKSMLGVVVIKEAAKALAGSKRICMTGTGPKGRKELIADIAAKGDMFVDTVGKDTDILLCGDINGTSSKLVKASKLGVKLVAYGEYFK